MNYTKTDNNRDARTDEELCRLAQQGNREAEEHLVVRYFSAVKSYSRTYFLAGADGEDLIQEGMLGLLKAVRAYSPQHNVPFAAFARTCILRRIYSVVSAAASPRHEPLNHSERIEGNPLLGEGGKAETEVADPMTMIIGMEERQELRERLEALLSPFESKVLQLYLDGRSYDEMESELNRPTKAVYNAIQRIRRKAATLFPKTKD